jgi:hypothetical protein
VISGFAAAAYRNFFTGLLLGISLTAVSVQAGLKKMVTADDCSDPPQERALASRS